MDDQNKKPSFCTRLGYTLGCVVASCVTLLVGGAAVAFTAKAVTMLFLWLF